MESPTIMMTFVVSHRQLHVNANVSLSLEDIRLKTGASILFDVKRLLSMSFQHLFSSNACVMAPVSSLQLYNMLGDVGRISMEANVTLEMFNKGQKRLNIIKKGEKETVLVNNFIAMALSVVEATVNGAGNLTLSRAPFLCQGIPNPREAQGSSWSRNSVGNPILLVIGIAITALLVFLSLVSRQKNHPFLWEREEWPPNKIDEAR